MIAQRQAQLSSDLLSQALQVRRQEFKFLHDSLTEAGLGLGAAFVAECGFEGLLQFGLEAEKWEGRERFRGFFVTMMVVTLCLGINAVVLCGSVVVWGPAKALRGGRPADVHASIDGMDRERRHVVQLLFMALTSLQLGCLPLVWALSYSVGPPLASVLTVLVVIGASCTSWTACTVRRKYDGEEVLHPFEFEAAAVARMKQGSALRSLSGSSLGSSFGGDDGRRTEGKQRA